MQIFANLVFHGFGFIFSESSFLYHQTRIRKGFYMTKRKVVYLQMIATEFKSYLSRLIPTYIITSNYLMLQMFIMFGSCRIMLIRLYSDCTANECSAILKKVYYLQFHLNRAKMNHELIPMITTNKIIANEKTIERNIRSYIVEYHKALR